jgi:DNA-binding transcriptional LysR family regulator
MVAAGLGVAIVPGSVSAIAPGGVVYRPTEPRAELERWAVWREEAPLAVVQAFVTSLPLDGEEPPPPPRR